MENMKLKCEIWKIWNKCKRIVKIFENKKKIVKRYEKYGRKVS